MTHTMNNLFAANNSINTVSNGRSLSGTVQLTNLSAVIVDQIIDTINQDIDTYSELLEDSKSDNDAMDRIINECYSLEEVDRSFLGDLSGDNLEAMLKSQQSKRSRCKSKAMTLDNYKSMMNAAIAETLIRLALGKEKSKGGFHHSGSVVGYTEARLEELAADQERLGREIRNIQSKKSIMKSKADFSETDERWIALLNAEQQLKDLRVSKQAKVVEVDTTKEALQGLLDGTDINSLHAADSKALLAKIAEMLG